jgi:UDP-glucose 4-epimerase
VAKILITGAAGFIGSAAVEHFLSLGHEVVGLDNFKTGKRQFLEDARMKKEFQLVEIDLYEDKELFTHFKNVELVLHLAANADVRFGRDYPRRDLEQNTIVTHNVLEACRIAGVKKFAFSSTGSVYGEAEIVPTPENAPFPIQTSLYGASKLACEGLIQGYAETFDIQTWIFRFVSILGPRYTHGHIFDFFAQLKQNSSNLKVLGDGYQNKSYLHVSDCILAIDKALNNSDQKVNIFNLGTADSCEVRESIGWIIDELGLNPEINFGSENKGWVGDNPLIRLDTRKIESLGWKPKFSIEDGVRDTVRYLQRSPKLFSL